MEDWHHIGFPIPQGVTGDVFFDNIQIYNIPEPATIVLAGLGFLNIIRSRKR
jgi:hypothetical protein